MAAPYKAALLVVDVQEDFCPPNGSLPVGEGRTIAPLINKLLAKPFALKIATQDWHPRDHVSFAPNHPPPNNKPFESTITVKNPLNEEESETVRLWPIHCVQGTQGADFIPELDISGIDHVVKKGQDSRVEMFSAFRDTYKSPCVSDSGVSKLLQDASITHVFVTGLARDVCVKHTALHAAEEGYETYIVEEASKAADATEDGFKKLQAEMNNGGVRFCNMSGPELSKVGA